MNEYSYSDLYVGYETGFEVVISETMLERFKDITGDNNPLHTDRAYAESKGYPQCVVYGMLTASFLSTLAGVYLPGEKSLIHSVETKFLKPVFVGDRLYIRGEVLEKHDLFRLLTLRVLIVNQNKEKVLKGRMKVGVLDE